MQQEQDDDNGEDEPIRNNDARISIRKSTRDEIRNLKRGGETYDSVLRKMIDQYDPDEADHER